MSYCLFNLHVGSVRTSETAKLQTAAFSRLAQARWEENVDLSEDSKLDERLNVNISVYFKELKSLMLWIISKSLFYSSWSIFTVKREDDFFAGV